MTFESNVPVPRTITATCPYCARVGTVLNVQEVEQEHRYPILSFDDDGDPCYGEPVVAWTVYVTNEARCTACGWKHRGDGWVDLVRDATLN